MTLIRKMTLWILLLIFKGIYFVFKYPNNTCAFNSLTLGDSLFWPSSYCSLLLLCSFNQLKSSGNPWESLGILPWDSFRILQNLQKLFRILQTLQKLFRILQTLQSLSKSLFIYYIAITAIYKKVPI